MKIKFKLPDELKFITNSRLPQKYSNESLDGKVCIITGTTSGVGYETTIQLAKSNAKIVMIVRNREKAEKLCKEILTFTNYEPEFFLADFTDLSQVRKATENIRDKFKRIDLLINNVGVHMTTKKLTKEGHETAFCVNHLAPFLITSLLLKRMVESAPSRIIQVNSEGHRFNGLRIDDLKWEKRPYRGIKGYGASKTAQLMTVWEFSEILKNKGVTINAMHPGAVKSNIGTNNGKLYNWYSKILIQPLLKNPIISGKAIFYLASSPDLEGITGKFFNLTNEEIPASHAMNREIGKVIFKQSMELVNLNKENCYEI